MSAPPISTYTVVVRCAESLIRLPFDRAIAIGPVTSEYGGYHLVIRTRAERVEAFSTLIPRELWIEVTGPAPSMDIAVRLAAAYSEEFVRQIAFATNAWQGLLSIHLGYESTPDLRERPFFQNWIRDETGLPRVAREIDPDLIFRVLVAIASLPIKQRSRFMRAVIQYSDALQQWRLGGELYAASHLFMGAEAITPLALEQELKRRGLKTRKDLERELNGPPPTSLALRIAAYLYTKAGGRISSKLDSWARLTLIFKEDLQAYRVAKAVSDKFEHGIEHHSALHQQAKDSINRTAFYLRDALFALIPLSDADRRQLQAHPYADPMASSGFERQLRGKLVSDHTDLAAEGDVYPVVRWEFSLLDLKHLADGRTEMRVAQKIAPRLGRGVSLTVEGVAFAGPTPTDVADLEMEVVRGSAQPSHAISGAGVELSLADKALGKWIHPFGSFILNSNVLPHLGRYWLSKLATEQVAVPPDLPLGEVASIILQIIAESPALLPLREKCESAWREAVELHHVRAFVAVARPEPAGLTVQRPEGTPEVRVMDDVATLVGLSDRVVAIVQRLTALLDDVVIATTASKQTT